MEKDFDNLQIKRKLASIQKVVSLTKIDNDPNNEIARILGWQVIVPKNHFKENELVVYFEIDSKLPDDYWCEDEKFYDYHVQTIKMGDIISQGAIKPLTILGKENDGKFKEGDDVTELLGITKYDEEETANRIIEDMKFPIHLIPFTDEPRVQSEPRYLEFFKNKPYVATLKFDGTSASFVLNPNNTNELWVCSRNNMIDPKKKNDYWKIAETYKIKEKLQKYPDYAIQGEVYGPGIQKNILNMKEKTLAVFTVYSLKNKRCLDYDDMVEFLKEVGLPCVTVVERGDSFNYDLDALLELAKGKYEGTENNREGIVFRLAKNWHSLSMRASFKIINNEYLLKK